MTDTKPIQPIRIDTGRVSIPVEIDGQNGRHLDFNPNDVLFMERLHRFYREVMEKAKEWNLKIDFYEKTIGEIPLDDNGVPETLDPAIDPVNEMNQFMRAQIDKVFGAGTAESIFGDAVYRNAEIYVQLIEGVAGYVKPVRMQKVQNFIAPKRKARKRSTAKTKKGK